jgi:DNA (cytosine-5)-methyltransferase 1
MHKFPYRWTLKDARFTKDKGKVFSCFACGGGSTMGYKLAGFDVIGCNEIDPRMNKVYVANHHPRLNYLCDIREMVTKELPDELYHLDVLDGSPPCSTFSMMGNREEDWGKEKHFREGQAEQVLDTLFFDFIGLAKELQPKVVIAENVEGLLQGEAFKYVQRIYAEFDKAGYAVLHRLLNSMTMGVPQMRKRTIFCAIRKDLIQYIPTDGLFGDPYINLDFNEDEIPFGMIRNDAAGGKELSPYKLSLWEQKQPGDWDCGDVTRRIFGQERCFTDSFVFDDKVIKTINTSALDKFMLWEKPRRLNASEVVTASTFPQDYNFGTENPAYLCGMSVPPVMMAQVASRVYDQWLSKIQE